MKTTINLVYGEDEYIKGETLKQIREKSGVSNNINYVNMNTPEALEIIDELHLPPFLGASKCINIYNSKMFLEKNLEKIYEKKHSAKAKKDTKKETDKNSSGDSKQTEGYILYEYFRNMVEKQELYLIEGIHIIFIEEKEKPKDIEKSSLYNLFLKLSKEKNTEIQNVFKVYNCKKQTKIEKQKYLLDIAKQNNINIDYNTIGYMLENTFDDTLLNIQEFKKIMLTNKGINGEKILNEDIDQICIKTDEALMFEITEMLIKKNKMRALEIVNNFKGQELMIIGYLYKYFRNIYLTIVAIEERQEKYLIQILDLKPNQQFLTRKYIDMAKRIGKNKVKYILKQLTILDEKMKSETIDANTSIKNIMNLV